MYKVGGHSSGGKRGEKTGEGKGREEREEGRREGKNEEETERRWCVAGWAVISGRRVVAKTRCFHWVSCKDVSGKITVSHFQIQTIN